MTPSTPTAVRVANLFGRKLSTHWSDREIRQYKKLVKSGSVTTEELDVIEKYYAYERRKEDKGIHRRDLSTFLNNFGGELDRARAWAQKRVERPRNAQNTAVGMMRPELTDEQIARNKEVIAREIEKLRKQFAMPPLVREAVKMFDATVL